MSNAIEDAIDRFEAAVDANGYRTSSDLTEREYREAKTALISDYKRRSEYTAELEAQVAYYSREADRQSELLKEARSHVAALLAKLEAQP